MAAHPYTLRTRLNGQSPSLRTPTRSSVSKTGTRSPRKPHASSVSLQLQQVIGTTTSCPPGLASCPLTNSYAYCAGAVAVLASVRADGTTARRYFKARPTAASLNPSSSYYESCSPSTTPSRRRTSIFARRKTQDAVSLTREWQDDGGSQTWTARERIKTVTCVALSANGKWLAVGELGYSPRVLLYSTSEDALLDIPISIVSDHAFGVKCVAFSPDSRYLATLGNPNDGFLFIWAINPRTGSLTLHSANKCTTNICVMTWCGQSLFTAGTRHVKIWNIGQPIRSSPSKRPQLRSANEEAASPGGPATLSGRNALLGSLVDCTFTSASALDERTLLLGADTGQLCAIQVSEGSPEVKVLKTFDFALTSMCSEPVSRKLVLGGRNGIIYEDYSTVEALLSSNETELPHRSRSPRKSLRSSAIRQSLGLVQLEAAGVSALAYLSRHIVALDSDGHLHVSSEDETQADLSFACHNNLIQGVQKLPESCSLGMFYTWSRRGEVRFWDADGGLLQNTLVQLDQADVDEDGSQNELRVLRFISSTRQFVLGDRFGIIKLLNSENWDSAWTGRAHGAEITDIATHEVDGFLATCGRDRMVQLFHIRGNDVDLIQTLDDHIGAVSQVMFSADADKLLSCSVDRTIVVREKARRGVEGTKMTAYLAARVVTLRSTPLSMAFFDPAATVLVAATNDRHLVKIDLSTGAILESTKVIDPENDDTVALSSLCMSARKNGSEDVGPLLAAYSSTDKSVRVYDADKSMLLTRESGHTEGISDLCLIERSGHDSDGSQRVLVSTGLDGTIMIWSIVLSSLSLSTPSQEKSEIQAMQGWESDGTPVKPSPVSLPPLRKLLTKMDMVEFTKSPGTTSPSSPRSLSPPRLIRKRSQLALSSTIDEKDEDTQMSHEGSTKQKATAVIPDAERSPSPSPAVLGKLKKQRSRADMSSETRRVTGRRSPSPPPMPVSTPTTPRRQAGANNSRLRRPPSVPTDLRGQALAQGRRQSMSQASDFGSMGMATEQACRMLRTYRKKLMGSKEDLGLEELEDELELMTNLVRERKKNALKKASANNSSGNSASREDRGMKAKAVTESDVDDLVVLLDRTNMGER